MTAIDGIRQNNSIIIKMGNWKDRKWNLSSETVEFRMFSQWCVIQQYAKLLR